MAAAGNEAELYDIFVSCSPLYKEMMDLRDPQLERLQEEAQRSRRQPTASSIIPSPSDTRMVTWGLPAVPLQQISPDQGVRRRRRTARIPRKLRLNWHPINKDKMDPAMKIARKKFRLPTGWTVVIKTRSDGQTAGRNDKYYDAPDGTRHRSLTDVIRALELVGV